MIYEKMLKESQRLELEINNLEKEIKNLPSGKLICASNGKWKKWYRSDGKKSIYIPKKERKLACDLAKKKFLSLQLEHREREKRAIGRYLKFHDTNAFAEEQSLISSLEYKDLLSDFYRPVSEELNEWSKQPYSKNLMHPETLIHKTYSGNLVRSKSEALIDMFLYKNQIPFRYESPLELDGILLYPDFTIRHPQTGQYHYWEHFGLMDNESYCKSTCSKLQLYISNNIIPTIQLITTYETKEAPLDPETVEKIVRHYFL